MDIHFYVRDAQETEYPVGRVLMPVVPRVGETVWLRMSLMAKAGIAWRLNPANPVRFDTAYFQVDAVGYDAWNIAEMEEGMGAAPYAEGSVSHEVICYVHAINEDTQVYVDRILARGE